MSNLTSGNIAMSLKRVWDILSTNLRDVRSQLHDVNDQLYGVQDRIAYMEIIQDAFKFITERRVSKVESYFELEELLGNVSKTEKYGSTVTTLKDFHERCKKVFRSLQDIKTILTDSILQFLELYCSDYRKLGIADDSFYNSLQSRTTVVENYMERFDELSEIVNNGTSIPQDLFGYSFFSQELSIQLDCDSFPVLRVIPDLIQKLEMSCDIAADWLRTDKVYVQEMEKEIESFKGKVIDIDKAVEMKKVKNDCLFANLKTKKTKLKLYDYKKIKAEMTELETNRAHIELGLPAMDQNNTSSAHNLTEAAENLIIETNAEVLESEIDVLSKKIRATGRQKMKLVEELKWCQGQVDRLTGLQKEKMYPDQKQREVVRSAERSKRKAEIKTKSKKQNSEELEEAFNIVKNSIGLGWKDLARALPYSPYRDPQEINWEIKAIEHENQGQLKEQAYQTLIQWSSHNGRRASIERLQETLRELHENKLADEIEENLGENTDAENDSSRPSSSDLIHLLYA